MKRFLLVGAVMVAGVLGLGSPAAKADPLTLNGIDDLSSFKLGINYTFTSNPVGGTLGTGQMTVNYAGGGLAWTLWPSVDNHTGSPLATYPTGDAFTLVANFTVVNATTVVVTSGTLNVTAGGNPLYTSRDLVAFGYSVSGTGLGVDQWQFEFTQGGGTYGLTGPIGVDLHGGGLTAYKGGGLSSYDKDVINFTQDFSNTTWNNGSADTFVVVPLPKALWMTLALPALLLIVRRRTQAFSV